MRTPPGEAVEVAVCVVGAGPVGAALACRLAAGGMPVAVVDRAALPPMEHPDFDGRAYAIAAGYRRLLEAAGVWARLPLPSGPIEDIRVSDGQAGAAGLAAVPAFRPRRDRDEPFGWMVEARSLRVALNARCMRTDDAWCRRRPRRSVTRDEAGALVRIGDGRTIRARLVVAAEGREIPLRRQAGIPVTRLAYQQRGLVCAVAHERPHRNQALEHFLPGGPFAQLPMAGTEGAPNVSAIVWTERAALAERTDGAGRRRLRPRGEPGAGPHLGAIRPVGRRWNYPLSAMHAQRYVDTRLVLVGDAAHGIHPIAGQGSISASATSIALPAWCSTRPGRRRRRRRRRCWPLPAARRPANLLMLAATDVLDRLFSTDNPVVRAARDLGIAGVHRMPRLRAGLHAGGDGTLRTLSRCRLAEPPSRHHVP